MKTEFWLKIHVTFDDELVVPCLWDGADTWNGWVVPFFDRTSVQKIIDYVNAQNDPWNAMKWDGEEVVEYTPAMPSDERRWTSVQIDSADYWSVGGGSWTWEEAGTWDKRPE
jgi:hypothetical protein